LKKPSLFFSHYSIDYTIDFKIIIGVFGYHKRSLNILSE